LYVFTNEKPFKTVLINNIDNLSYYAQTSLRRTMEKYSGTCRFIMWSRSLSKVIDPLISRCYCFRVESPKIENIIDIVMSISLKEKIRLDIATLTYLLNKADRNIKLALWLLECVKYDEDFEMSYDNIIDDIVDVILEQDISCIKYIIELLYKIMVTNITGSNIVSKIVHSLLEIENINKNCKAELIINGAAFEHKIIRCRREIMQLEPFIINCMFLLRKYGFKKIE